MNHGGITVYLEINQASNADAKNEDKEYEHDN